MQIRAINDTLTMTGKFNLKPNLSPENKIFMEKFIEQKNVKKLVKKKPYDINASQNNRGFVSLTSTYNKYSFDGKEFKSLKIKSWYSNLDKDANMQTNYERLLNGLKLFEFGKDLNNGYNTKLEEIKSKALKWFDVKVLKKTEDVLDFIFR